MGSSPFKLFTEGMHFPGEPSPLMNIKRSSAFTSFRQRKQTLPPESRAPGFAHLQGMDEMAKGYILADVVAPSSDTQDIVFEGRLTDNVILNL